MDGIIEFRGSLDGRSYSCQYRRTYHESLQCYAFTMVPGSLSWESITSGDEVHAASLEIKNEPMKLRSLILVRRAA
jgi:hypothetical protein